MIKKVKDVSFPSSRKFELPTGCKLLQVSEAVDLPLTFISATNETDEVGEFLLVVAQTERVSSVALVISQVVLLKKFSFIIKENLFPIQGTITHNGRYYNLE